MTSQMGILVRFDVAIRVLHGNYTAPANRTHSLGHFRGNLGFAFSGTAATEGR